MNKYSVSLHGHATSVSLEAEFWEQICQIAEARQQSVASLISEIDDEDKLMKQIRAHDRAR